MNADHLLRPGRKTTLELLLRVAVSVVVVAAIMGLLPLVAELAG